MKIKEIRNLSESELDKKLGELTKELIKLGAQVSTGTQLQSPGKVRQLKQTKARILTVQKERGNQKDE